VSFAPIETILASPAFQFSVAVPTQGAAPASLSVWALIASISESMVVSRQSTAIRQIVGNGFNGVNEQVQPTAIYQVIYSTLLGSTVVSRDMPVNGIDNTINRC